MIRVALKGLAGRKLRALLTALAIVLGVAMISGTYVLTDTIDKAFNSIFAATYRNASAVISSKVAFSSQQQHSRAPGFPDTVLAKVRALPDVADAAGSVTSDEARLVSKKGKAIVNGGAPNLGFSVDPRETRFNPLTLVQGRWARGPDEIAIDKATADKQHFMLGDEIGVVARGPQRHFRIVGIAELAQVSSIGGATLAAFDLSTAQSLFEKKGKLDVIRVASRPNVPRAKLLADIRAILPPTAQVRDPTKQAAADAKDTSSFVSIIQKFLLAFGFVALFVGAFVIFNTLSITVAQRTREFATLRTLGATRRQVRVSVLIEGLVIGVLASLIGLFLGLGLAKGLNALFVAVGIDLPKSGTVFKERTVVVSLLVGILITLVASLMPAFRATRVPPIAAVREGAVLPKGRFHRFTPYLGLALVVLGLAMLFYGVLAHHKAFSARLVFLGPGVLLLFVGVALFASKLVRPLASVLGWPAARFAGAPGTLARDNAIRNPSRTASTAAALMIGLTLVTFVAVLGKGLRTSFEESVRAQFIANYAVTSQNNFSPFDPASTKALASVPGVTAVTNVRGGDGRAFGKSAQVTAVEPNLQTGIHIDWIRGATSAVPRELGADGAFVDKKYADRHHLSLGSTFELESPTGKILPLTLKGIFDPTNGGSPFGQVTISTKAFDAAFPQPENLYSFVNMNGGVTDENTKTLDRALASFPVVKVASRDRFVANQEKFIKVLLNLLYVLLALSIVISLFGIVNTLVLSVFERTRELGMLRAVGTTRWQVRLMIGFESITTALIGATLGLILGLFLAALVIHPLADQGILFAVPYGTLAIFMAAAILAGIVAAIFPARRASRLNVLEALQYE